MTNVTVSGSFHRHLTAIMDVVSDLKDRGLTVLSPEDPRIADVTEGFIFVVSDRHRSVRLVQDRHLASICCSDFLWLVAPDGYVGQSASLEIGFAVARGIPVFSSAHVPDLTIQQYVQRVSGIDEALSQLLEQPPLEAQRPSILVDPEASIDAAQDDLDEIRAILIGNRQLDNPATEVFQRRDSVLDVLRVPTTSG